MMTENVEVDFPRDDNIILIILLFLLLSGGIRWFIWRVDLNMAPHK